MRGLGDAVVGVAPTGDAMNEQADRRRAKR
jgi:hypothetical protein